MVKGGTYIIKRGGKRKAELFQEEKLRSSIAATCIGSGSTSGQADTIADQVVKDVVKWLADKPEVTSRDIRRITSQSLTHYNNDAGYLYSQQEKII